MSDQWLWMSAADLGRGIESGEIDAVALTERYLAAIEDHPDSARIYARTTPHRARAEAKAAAIRAKSGRRLSPLDGVPISWKDLFDTAGVATEAGTALLKGRTPDTDAKVLSNATAAGLVCLGKTHMSELAFSGLGLNPITGTPPNVTDPKAAPGGSSSGAAASVAFGLAAAGIGSDTGGSVRVPAAWNDLIGLKTAPGTLPLDGTVPLCPLFDTVGPLTRTVEDAALLTAIMGGTPVPDLTGASLEGARFLLLATAALDDLRDPVRAGFTSAVERLRGAGAMIDRVELPFIEETLALSGILYASEAYGTWETEIEANPDAMFPEILGRFRAGKSYKASDYVAAWQKVHRDRQAWATATAGYDAVLVPTSPIQPPDVERLLEDREFYVSENLLTLRNTRIGNLMGLAGLTIPTGVPATGIQFMTEPGSEMRLARLGIAAEKALS